MFEQIRNNIDLSLSQFLGTVKKDYKLHLVSPLLFDSVREFTLRKGKRLRPLLLILTYKGYAPASRKISRKLYNASTCMEFLHNFMLIHDDIIDRSDLRRGKPTLHRLLAHTVATQDPEKLGIDLGIIAGDIVYALAIDAFLSIDEPSERKEQALKYFIQTAAFTAMGEFIDTVSGVKPIKDVDEKEVYLNYTLKTARYTFDCPMVTGAILAGAKRPEIKKISRFGILIGQAFQIQDDIIGIFETEDNIGKSILSDLAEGKKTLLVTHAFSALKGGAKTKFLRIFSQKKQTLADLETVKKIFVQAGSLDYALAAIHTRLTEARKILQALSMHRQYSTLLEGSISKLFEPSQKISGLYQSGG
ncbi:MAG: polyprenyl synthetase family protein [Candidatus Omnitrophica bacterium]|nr:polyprenyl synthetase family protein [Candidatus Omnitrophota bacterium]